MKKIFFFHSNSVEPNDDHRNACQSERKIESIIPNHRHSNSYVQSKCLSDRKSNKRNTLKLFKQIERRIERKVEKNKSGHNKGNQTRIIMKGIVYSVTI